MKDRIARSVFWLGWSKGIVQSLSLLSTLYVARLLNPNDYGLMALTGIWICSLAMLAEMGLSAAVVQFRDLDDPELNVCFWLTLATAGIGYLGLYGVAPLIAAWFSTPLLTEVLRVASLNLLLAAVRIVPDSLLRKSLELDKVSQAEITGVAVSIPVQAGLAWAGAGVWALVTGMLLLAFTQSLVTFLFSSWRPGLQMGSRRLKDILSFSSAKLGGNLCWGFYDQVDIFILGKMSGDVVLGFYSMAKQIALLPVHKIATVVNQLAIPLMAELQSDRQRMCSAFLRQIRLVACLTTPLCVGITLVAEDLIGVTLMDKWAPAVPLLQVLCLSMVCHSFTTMMPPILLARYRAGFLFRWNASLLLTMPVVFWCGAAWGGGLGLALAWLTIYPLISVWMIHEVLKELGIGWMTMGSQLKPIFIASIMMVASVAVVGYMIPGSGYTDRVVRLVFACGFGALAYTVGVLWRGGLLGREIAEVTGWLLKRSWPLTATK